MSYRIVVATHNDGRLSYLEEEANVIKSILNQPSAGLEVNIIPGVKLQYIFKYFEDHQNDKVIGFHFAGHAGGLGLVIKNENGQDRQIKGENLAEFLRLQSSLKFVFLNACATREEAEAIANCGIPFVIATSKAIDDKVASLFARDFYESLKSCRKIPQAFQMAVAKIKTEVEGSLVKPQMRDLSAQWYDGESEQDPEPWRLLTQQPTYFWEFPLQLRTASNWQDRLYQLLVFCNREPQTTLFDKIWNTPNEWPQVCIIPGTLNSRHKSFARRVELQLLENPKVKNFIPKHLGRWTNCWKDPINQLKKLTFKHFTADRPISLDNGQSIIDQFAEGSVLVIHLEVDLDKWDEKAEQAIHWYVNSFWKFKIEKYNFRVFIFLHLIAPPLAQKTGWFLPFFNLHPTWRFLRQLERMKKRERWEHLFVFPPLEKISLNHLLRFIDDYEELQCYYEPIMKRFPTPNQNAKIWEMRYVEYILKTIIN